MLKEAGLGCGHPGEEEWELSGVLDCSMACWEGAPPLQGQACSVCSWAVTGNGSPSPAHPDRMGRGQDGDTMEPLSDPWPWICTGCHSFPGALHVQG